jgi:hypothetical protein
MPHDANLHSVRVSSSYASSSLHGHGRRAFCTPVHSDRGAIHGAARARNSGSDTAGNVTLLNFAEYSGQGSDDSAPWSHFTVSISVPDPRSHSCQRTRRPHTADALAPLTAQCKCVGRGRAGKGCQPSPTGRLALGILGERSTPPTPPPLPDPPQDPLPGAICLCVLAVCVHAAMRGRAHSRRRSRTSMGFSGRQEPVSTTPLLTSTASPAMWGPKKDRTACPTRTSQIWQTERG